MNTKYAVRRAPAIVIGVVASLLGASEALADSTGGPLAIDWPDVLTFALDQPVREASGPWSGAYVVGADSNGASSGSDVTSLSVQWYALGNYTSPDIPELLVSVVVMPTARLPEVETLAILLRPRVRDGAIEWKASKSVIADAPWLAGNLVRVTTDESRAKPDTDLSTLVVDACLTRPDGTTALANVTVDLAHSPTAASVVQTDKTCVASATAVVIPTTRSGRAGQPYLLAGEREARIRRTDAELVDSLNERGVGLIGTGWAQNDGLRWFILSESEVSDIEKLLTARGLEYRLVPADSHYAMVENPDGTRGMKRSARFEVTQEAMASARP